jgi:hypothetical protein
VGTHQCHAGTPSKTYFTYFVLPDTSITTPLLAAEVQQLLDTLAPGMYSSVDVVLTEV